MPILSTGGWTNGAGKPCDPAALQPTIVPTRFALANPNPGSTWVRGFTWYHNGIDITSGSAGTPLYAADVGVVIFAGWDPYGGGYTVKIDHCGGLATSSCHMQQLLVTLGQVVQAGQEIGLQGMTGDATGPHLHFMTWWDNTPFDPLCVYPHSMSVPQHRTTTAAPRRKPHRDCA